ncbi:hypothetical protein L3V77_05735 [Vibrio sp. DW001]|uniref:hypothetical protein n=1 Tax=Vibrio sp. DW001 TaxID=2912315 RepID=UPI0023B153B3|nr:hypothetical protein [Vibrio sp. DW001]WED27738.1 hypothetical protein L3V77_05735 [Vibrio sp. DW001]
MNILFKGLLFCIILSSTNVSAKSVSVSWEGVITLLYQPDLFSTIKSEDIQSNAEMLINDGANNVAINREYIIQYKGDNNGNKNISTSVVVVMYSL